VGAGVSKSVGHPGKNRNTVLLRVSLSWEQSLEREVVVRSQRALCVGMMGHA
jgi:hypothetical protein